MDPPASGAQAPRVAGPPPEAPLPSARESLPRLEAGFATDDHSGQKRETKTTTDQLASGAQSTHSDICTHGKGTHCGEEGFAEEADGELKAWELSEGTRCPPREQTADLFNEDWDLELKADQGNPYGGSSRSRSLPVFEVFVRPLHRQVVLTKVHCFLQFSCFNVLLGMCEFCNFVRSCLLFK
ncbi:coordinator of PRMT5 and differentiation stimulator isoform X1 [Perognathus longimembris pacificus]|uniref:coordinator of PRMT5 and differentiation stimulator isoform X1 n=1 Tax=Perognathus longimembris pacificus TaxID=214514 RepID=UPI00201851D2|nr:coordinator of PRMT5 and differentiation stimulator isoform X1 [Perognathus longimembris pacificus]